MRSKEEQKERDDLECYLYQKFEKDLGNERFVIKFRETWKEDYATDFEGMIESLADVVEQHIWDEELTLADLDKIETKQWDKWIEAYDYPEPECPRCGGGRGCNYCLMTGY